MRATTTTLHERGATFANLEGDAALLYPPLTHLATLTAPSGIRIVGIGGELKTSICNVNHDGAVMSEAIGNLTDPSIYRRFAALMNAVSEAAKTESLTIAFDPHPLYLSAIYVRQLTEQRQRERRRTVLVPVQHHHAHIASVMAEHDEAGPVIGIACDGTGYGADGVTWGCELLRCERSEFTRIGTLSEFPLIGGDAAAIETWRPAIALLREALGIDWHTTLKRDARQIARQFEEVEPGRLELATRMANASGRMPRATSLGRVFDAVAFLLGLCSRNSSEGEAAIALEAAARQASDRPVEAFDFQLKTTSAGIRMSIAPAIASLVASIGRGESPAMLAARFHETLAQMLTEAAVRASLTTGVKTAALAGGCFANRILSQRLCELLNERGLRVLRNAAVSCGDAGLSLGQAYVAAWRVREGK